MRKLLQGIFNHHYDIFKWFSFVLTAFFAIWLMPGTIKFGYEYHLGKPWQHQTLIAPFDFAIQKPDERLREERERIAGQVLPYFQLDTEQTETARQQLELKINQLNTTSEQESELIKNKALLLFDKVQTRGLLQHHPILDNRRPNQLMVNVIRDKVVTQVSPDDLFTVVSAYVFCKKSLDTSAIVMKQEVLEILGESFVQNLVFDEYTTQKEINQALQRVSSVYGMIQKGERIISEGEPVDEERFLIISSLKDAVATARGGELKHGMILAGHSLLIVALLAILFFYIRFMRIEIFNELKKINMILLLMLFVILPSYLVIDFAPNYIFMVPFGLLPILLITFFDSRTTFLVHLVATLMVAIHVPGGFQFVFQQLVMGYVVVYSLERHNRRSYFFRTSIFIFISFLVVYMGLNLLNSGDLKQIDISMIWKSAIGSLLTLLALPLIFILERIFGEITDLTLLELSNTNSLLLRELASVAPGTFQHSMQVANLAEEALYEIGGDVLLARTGALYHDIGKMDNPYYFIENQMGGYNPHNELPPRESAAIIINHVISGIEKARKRGLPSQIIDFIRTHHGTSRVNYFYVMEQRLHPGLIIDERDFRYRGPIPFSKETAVVMMADSVEAASRSIKNPTEQKINDLIENIVNKQFEDGQFLNANITIKELNTVKKILKKKMMNIYHVRIAYPD